MFGISFTDLGSPSASHVCSGRAVEVAKRGERYALIGRLVFTPSVRQTDCGTQPGCAAVVDKNPTVYFDGNCPMCRAEIGFYKRRKGADAINWFDISTCETNHIAADLDRNAAMARFHFRRADGKLLDGAKAFVELWATLPGFRPAARIARLPGITSALEMTYRGFLKIRPLMQRKCAHPDPKER